MKVNAQNPLYKKYLQDWQMIFDILAGERQIKNQGTKYLPQLSGQTQKEYFAYNQRGSLFNATARTLQGLIGAVVRKQADIEAPDNMKIVLEDITSYNQSIQEVIKYTIEQIISYGFFGILVDMAVSEQEANLPYMALYRAIDIINWKTKKEGKQEKLILLVLMETEVKDDPKDPFNYVVKQMIRVCFIDGTGIYKQQLYTKVEKPLKGQDEWEKFEDEIIPMKAGVPLNEIPFVFISSLGTFPMPSKPPLLDIADLNIKHWQVSTDYYHGLHYCAIPTPWAAGFKVKGDLYIGSQKAWVSEDAQAKCGYLEFTGSGLQAIEKSLDKLEALMAVMGARLLEEQKLGVEAPEAIKLRSSGDSATLSGIVTSVEQGILKALTFIAGWMNVLGTITIKINKDFVSQKLTPQDITALLAAVQAGRISMDTFLYNLQSGEVLPPERTIKEEKELIASEAPKDDFVSPLQNQE